MPPSVRGAKIQSHAFICTGVTIEDEVFVGHGALFINDKFPRATTQSGALKTDDDWELVVRSSSTVPR